MNVDKPAGMTSFRVVSLVKRLAGERRVGHAGTLDPSASGVLPICLGRATRTTQYLVEATKTYRAEIELGVATDTYDADGRVVQRGDIGGIDRSQLESALSGFRGLVKQVPPMYSALKYRGRPLYKLARAGITIERKPRLANIIEMTLQQWQPPLVTVEVVCGKGTYIRSIAHDLGQALGCGAHLQKLVRLRCGPFDIKDAISLPQLEDAFRHGDYRRFLYPMDIVLMHWPSVVISDEAAQHLKNGRPLAAEKDGGIIQNLPAAATSGRAEISPETLYRAYALDGRFIGVLRFNLVKREWQPEKVLL